MLHTHQFFFPAEFAVSEIGVKKWSTQPGKTKLRGFPAGNRIRNPGYRTRNPGNRTRNPESRWDLQPPLSGQSRGVFKPYRILKYGVIIQESVPYSKEIRTKRCKNRSMSYNMCYNMSYNMWECLEYIIKHDYCVEARTRRATTTRGPRALPKNFLHYWLVGIIITLNRDVVKRKEIRRGFRCTRRLT